MDVLKVQNLTKQFGKFKAVDSISFTLKKGEILGLLGPNGAGKTTTIQMLLGVLSPSSGMISYFGRDFDSNREEILEKVNFSSTYTNLPWNLTVRENLTYTSYLYNLPNRKEQLSKIVEAFRLQKLLNQTLTELSAGQLTRVNLAKAFVNNPTVLLLDEPTSSLDPEVAKMVREFILAERSKNELSIVFTSHNMSEVEEVCDRILFINNGIIVADDTPENLMKSLDTVRVRLVMDKTCLAALMSFGNQYHASIQNKDRDFVVELKESQVPDLLSYLANHKMKYYEISIDKPDLEDYFLYIAGQNKNRDL
ncbi:ABC transporter ATP-binding protein [Candidatus Roizmanbacteria bacterium]|nr:MAG: ABC transporter ATP-binding protein [Candidatus Roizmanbacteria bacterium]